jgi:hypothetical protein
MTPQMSDSITIGQSLTSTSNNNLPVDNDNDQQRNPQHIDVKVPFANNNNNNNKQRDESSMNFGSVENVDSSHEPVAASGKNLSESIVNVSFENFTATDENSLQSLGNHLQNNNQDGGDGTQTELDVALNTDINASMFKDMMNLDPFENMNNKDYENQTGDNKGSRLTSKYTSRTNSREGGNRIREIKQLKDGSMIPPNFVLEDPQLYENPNRSTRRPETPDSHPPTGPISRQQSLKLTKDRSFRDELSNGLRNRLRGMSNADLNNNRMFLENTPEHQHLETMIDTIYSSIAKNGMEPKDWNLIQIATPAPTKGMKSDQSTSTDDLEELLNTQLYELPIFDNQDNILVVKSYKPTVEGISFEQQLMKSQNPLFFIYQKYSSYLSHLQKERLFYASLLSTTMPMHPFNAIQQQQLTANSSSPMKPPVPGKMMIYPADSILVQRNRRHIYAAAHQILLTAQRLKEECYHALPIVDAIETVINDSVQIVKAVRRSEDIPSHQYLVNSLSDCYR